jgi:hypothetical protein
MSDLNALSVIELEGKKKSLRLAQAGIGTLGTVAGWVYANKTGGGFWRYVGFGFAGGVALGAIGYFTLMQRVNKIDTAIKLKESNQTANLSDEEKENKFFKEGGGFR